MTYIDTAPTLAEVQAALARDLFDPSHNTFSTTVLTQLINDGIVEVNRIAPLNVMDDITLVEEQTSYDTRFVEVYRVEVVDDTGELVFVIPYNDGDNRSGGYDLLGLTLVIPPEAVTTEMFEAYTGLTAKVTGYGRRMKADESTPDDPLELDMETELAVRWFAAFRGFMALMGDRSLYAQWQSQSNNTDVSMPMLMNLVATASREWERQKREITVLRRKAPGSVVVL